MRLYEVEFLARHGVLRDVQAELDRDFRVLCLQSCYTSLLCLSGPARTVPFLPVLIGDRVQIPDKPGSAKFIQDSAILATLLLVCVACPVSVDVRPVCLGIRDLQGTRDTTPVSCFGFAACQRCTALLVWHRWVYLLALTTHRRPMTHVLAGL